MLRFKRWSKCLVCLLLCAAVLSVPVSALAVKAPVSASLIPVVPELPVETPKAESQGHLVSVVYYSQYSGAAIIGCLEDGTRLTILKEYKNYYRIDCYDMRGYIAKSQVAVNENGEYIVKCQPDGRDTKYLPSYTPQEAMTLKSQIKNIADDYLGVRYCWGGMTPKGFDCSGFTQYVLNKANVTVNRSAIQQLQDGVIIAKEDLQCGDLVFFSNTGGRGFASHVGIYIGNGQIIHSGSSTGVTISDLSSSYYVEHYQCARRVVISDVAVTAGIIHAGIMQGSAGASGQDAILGGLGLMGK